MPKFSLRATFARKEKDATKEEKYNAGKNDPKSPISREESADEPPWTLLSGEWGSDDLLYPEIEEMYWDGVRKEVEVLLLTLKQWQEQWQQEQTNGDVPLPDEIQVDQPEGFDTFIDQVTEESRSFARRAAQAKRYPRSTENPDYRTMMSERMLDLIAEHMSSSIKEDVRASLEHGSDNLTPLERCAKLLLQSASFLDIEKQIEHNPTEEDRLRQKPDIPQLKLEDFDVAMKPFISPLACTLCRSPIRSSLYRKTVASPATRPAPAQSAAKSKEHICEDCFRKLQYGDRSSYHKVYKHCVLAESVPPDLSSRMCQCKSIPNRPRRLFPMSQQDKELHMYSEALDGTQCRIVKLAQFVAQAKYETTPAAIAQRKVARRPTSLLEFEIYVDKMRAKSSEPPSPATGKAASSMDSSLKNKRRISMGTTGSGPAASGWLLLAPGSAKQSVLDIDPNDEIPVFFKNSIEQNPYGNVRASLRMGPLLLSNGIYHGKNGVVITLRDPPILQKRQASPIRREIMIAGDVDRSMWARTLPAAQPRPYRAIMKQVVGMPFAGLMNKSLELEIVRGLAAASVRITTEMGGLTQAKRRQIMDDLIGQLVSQLRELIGSRARVYIDSIASRLLDPTMNLCWNAETNNCLDFSDGLINMNLFSSLIAPATLPKADAEAAPLYLMSFVCRPGAHARKQVIQTKYDVPKGLTEEYLSKYVYGGPSSDIIDSLQEYWHDWGAFGRNLYRFQDLFPWDCSEACGRYPRMCGQCNIAKHVWAFPFDSWSITALHLTRPPSMYPPTNPAVENLPTNPEWVRNRLTVLGAQEALIRVAAAMADNESFRAATEWLHQQQDPCQDRLKLGGIHRAQPFSHEFEPRTFATSLTAPWTLLQYQDQVAVYEKIRNTRMAAADIDENRRLTLLSPTNHIYSARDGSLNVSAKPGGVNPVNEGRVTAPYGEAFQPGPIATGPRPELDTVLTSWFRPPSDLTDNTANTWTQRPGTMGPVFTKHRESATRVAELQS